MWAGASVTSSDAGSMRNMAPRSKGTASRTASRARRANRAGVVASAWIIRSRSRARAARWLSRGTAASTSPGNPPDKWVSAGRRGRDSPSMTALLDAPSDHHAAVVSSRQSFRRTRRAALAGGLAGPIFLGVSAGLTWVDAAELRGYGWQPLNHHGVPWPSALSTTAHGAIQIANFTITGLLVLALASVLGGTLPRRPSGTVARMATGAVGAGVALAALPVGVPPDDWADPLAWCASWHGTIHLSGLVVAAVAALVALVSIALATRRQPGWGRWARASAGVAIIVAASLA